MRLRFAILLLATSCGTSPEPRIRVLPLFFVPSDQDPPTEEQKRNLMRHATWSQTRYRELLGGITFRLEPEVEVIRASHPLLSYRHLPEDGVPHTVREIFAHHGVDRNTSPHIYVIVLMNPCENWPTGGGRPFNGGFDKGGGLVILSSWFLDHAPIFQSTLQHELGHAFGLPHVDVYGDPLGEGPSMMSYNEKHWSRGFEPSETPGGFIAEDRRGLALNQKAFPGLRFEGADVRKVVELGPMTIADAAPEPPKPHGYELFINGVRAGHSAEWTRKQGMENLEWNRKDKPGAVVEGRYDGKRLP